MPPVARELRPVVPQRAAAAPPGGLRDWVRALSAFISARGFSLADAVSWNYDGLCQPGRDGVSLTFFAAPGDRRPVDRRSSGQRGLLRDARCAHLPRCGAVGGAAASGQQVVHRLHRLASGSGGSTSDDENGAALQLDVVPAHSCSAVSGQARPAWTEDCR